MTILQIERKFLTAEAVQFDGKNAEELAKWSGSDYEYIIPGGIFALARIGILGQIYCGEFIVKESGIFKIVQHGEFHRKYLVKGERG